MKKFLLGLGGILLVGAVTWTALFFTVPQVKDWTLHDVFKIERTVEDEPTDENQDPDCVVPPEDSGETDTETGDVVPGDDPSILPEDGPVTPEENPNENTGE